MNNLEYLIKLRDNYFTTFPQLIKELAFEKLLNFIMKNKRKKFNKSYLFKKFYYICLQNLKPEISLDSLEDFDIEDESQFDELRQIENKVKLNELLKKLTESERKRLLELNELSKLNDAQKTQFYNLIRKIRGQKSKVNLISKKSDLYIQPYKIYFKKPIELITPPTKIIGISIKPQKIKLNSKICTIKIKDIKFIVQKTHKGKSGVLKINNKKIEIKPNKFITRKQLLNKILKYVQL